MTVPLLSEHETWLSADPVLGCPARCSYCYLHGLGLVGRAPAQRATPRELVDAVVRYFDEESGLMVEPRPRLVCLGNHTDMLMTPSNRAFTAEYAALHHARLPQVPLVLVTKAVLTEEVVRSLDRIDQAILILASQSFLSWTAEGAALERGTATPEQTAAGLRLVAATTNLRGLHFWRPLTSLSVPSDDAALRQLRLIRDAGAVASVAVGLKAGRGLRTHLAGVGGALARELEGPRDEQTPLGEHLDPAIRRRALAAGRALGHPVYLNTSCAVAWALCIPEFLGTMHPPAREARCEPAVCPAEQRRRCAEAPRRTADGDLAMRTARFLGLPGPAVRVVATGLTIEGRLAQDTRCRVAHATGVQVSATDEHSTREWHGAMFPVGPTGAAWDVALAHPSVPWRLVDRLRRVTGMMSPVGAPGDDRPSVFSRFLHVRRVASVAHVLAAGEGAAGSGVDVGRVALLSWCHDLNRWAFAHNAERGRFDPAKDVHRYAAAHALDLSPDLLRDLTGIIDRRAAALSSEGRVVLAADRATGICEDLFLALVAFAWPPESLPRASVASLGCPLLQPGIGGALERLRELYRPGPRQDINRFIVECDRIVTTQAVEFVRRHCHGGRVSGLAPSFDAAVAAGRTTLLEEHLFPVINERIARGRRIRSRVVDPLMGRHRRDAVELMTSLDDGQVLELAVQEEIISSADLVDLWADVGYSHDPTTA